MFVLWFNIQRKIEMTAHIQIVHGVKMPYLCLFCDSSLKEKLIWQNTFKKFLEQKSSFSWSLFMRERILWNVTFVLQALMKNLYWFHTYCQIMKNLHMMVVFLLAQNKIVNILPLIFVKLVSKTYVNLTLSNTTRISCLTKITKWFQSELTETLFDTSWRKEAVLIVYIVITFVVK